jgi:Skp family chaperone for outer membrane proteins
MNGRVLFGMLAIVPGMFLLQVTGSPSVAVINLDRVLAEAPGGKDAIAKLNAFSGEQRTAIEKKQKEALDMQNRLLAQDRVLSETARAQLIRDLDAAQASIQTMGEEAQQKIEKMEQELLGPVQQKTANAVRSYATEHSLKIILDASTLQNGLVYVHDTADITTEIIRRTALNMDGPTPRGKADTAIGHIRMNRPWADFRIPRANPDVSDPGDSLALANQHAQ